MISIKNTSVMNFENAIRGARNPMNSWDRSDSYIEDGKFILGQNDLTFAKKLCIAGTDERKFIRQIFVSVDICAPLYWWKEFDTYKVGTVSNSTSTMHKIHSKPFSLEDFSIDHMTQESRKKFVEYIEYIEWVRLKYNQTKDKTDWYDLIQLLPSSYNQLRTCTLNYENLFNIYYARRNHKLDEWHVLCDWIMTLPYTKELFVKKD